MQWQFLPFDLTSPGPCGRFTDTVQRTRYSNLIERRSVEPQADREARRCRSPKNSGGWTLFLMGECAYRTAVSKRPRDCLPDISVEDLAMRNASSALVGGIVIVAVVHGFASAGRAGADDDQHQLGRRSPSGLYRPWPGEFDVQGASEVCPYPRRPGVASGVWRR